LTSNVASTLLTWPRITNHHGFGKAWLSDGFDAFESKEHNYLPHIDVKISCLLVVRTPKFFPVFATTGCNAMSNQCPPDIIPTLKSFSFRGS